MTSSQEPIASRPCSRAGAFLLLSLAACATAAPVVRPTGTVEPGSSITLVESAPIETTLDHPDVPNAHLVWLEMIKSAKRTLDIAQFYASDEDGSRLTPIIAAVQDAARRGVRVRFLLDDSFAAKYPDTIEQFQNRKNIELRRLIAGRRMGGVLHAKYFIVDRKEAYLGSQNFDWRSLEHIQEMGVRIRSKPVATELLDVFGTDWELAGGSPDSFRMRHDVPWPVRLETGELVTFVASPKGWLPHEDEWDLPHMVKAIDSARSDVAVQLLTYGAHNRDGSHFPELDEALRRAAGRGVKVRLLVSDWSNKPRSAARASISDLSRVPGIEVNVITIPLWSGGSIPFARVCHSKFLVVDGRVSWVGTSNWEGDYFYKSRNVGVVVESEAFTGRLTEIFDNTWGSPYSKKLDPAPKNEPIQTHSDKPRRSRQDSEKDY